MTVATDLDPWSAERIVDRLRIQEVLYLYCRAIDRVQPDLLASLFHPDAIIDKGDGAIPVAAFVTNVATRHPSVPRASHMVANYLVDFLDPDSAFVESWCLAIEQHMPATTEARTVDRVYRVRYGDHFARRNGGWRIALRTFVTDHVLSVAVAEDLQPGDGGRHTGRRGTDDVLFTMRQRLLREVCRD